MVVHGWIQEILVNNSLHIRGKAYYGDLEFDVLVEHTDDKSQWAIKVGDLCVAFPGPLSLSPKLQTFEISTHKIILKKKSKATVFVLTDEKSTGILPDRELESGMRTSTSCRAIASSRKQLAQCVGKKKRSRRS